MQNEQLDHSHWYYTYAKGAFDLLTDLYHKVVVTYPFSLYLIYNTQLSSIMCTNQIQITWMCYKH